MELKLAGSPERVDELDYWTAASGGGGSMRVKLPIARLPVHGLPEGLAGLLMTADLQGVALSSTGVRKLLGVVLVEHLAGLAAREQLPPLSELGAILAGDLYSHPRATERGATGDVLAVWLAFAQKFRFLAGVAGNHDVLEGPDYERMLGWSDVAHLDASVFSPPKLDLKIGGVSGIVGRKGKHLRRKPEDFAAAISRCLAEEPDILVMHDGPQGALPRQIGRPEINEALRGRQLGLTVRGHCYWPEPIWERDEGLVLNVDSRVFVLVPAA